MLKSIQKFLKPRKTLRLILDAVGLVLVWRGIWGILDLFFFPDNPLVSYIGSLIFGFIFLILDGNGLDELK